MNIVTVWDLPLRIFHWSLALLVGASIASGIAGGNWMNWHGKFGVALTGLLVFRLIWGFAGSTHARFASFVRGPAAIRQYLRGQWSGLGHSPLGALAVIALLSMLAVQIASGLVGNDDIAFNGPLYALVGKDSSDWATGLHRKSFWLFASLIALHLAAIVFYLTIRKNNLLLPMLTGRRRHHRAAAEPSHGGRPLALVLAVGLGVAAAWAAAGGFLPAPAEAANTAAPSW